MISVRFTPGSRDGVIAGNTVDIITATAQQMNRTAKAQELAALCQAFEQMHHQSPTGHHRPVVQARIHRLCAEIAETQD